MTFGKDAEEIVKAYEGLRLEAYRCPAGIPTIGWGHTGGVKMGDVIDRAEAERLLAIDLEEAAKIVRQIPAELKQNQFDALVSFAMNVGPGKPGVRDGLIWLRKKAYCLSGGQDKPVHSTLYCRIARGEWDKAADEILKWDRSGGKVLPGLVARRRREMLLFKVA